MILWQPSRRLSENESAKFALKELLFSLENNKGEWLSEYSLQGEEEEHRHDCTCRQCYNPGNNYIDYHAKIRCPNASGQTHSKY